MLLPILAGFVLLLIGGELLVRGAVRTASALGVSPLVIGLTLVGFGTSTPELVTSIRAAFAGSPGIAVGNVVGSNICNILLILGLAALIRPIATTRASLKRDGLVLAAATVICVGVLLSGSAGRVVGLAFIAMLVGYIVWAYLSERGTATPETEAFETPERPAGILFAVLLAVAGIVLVILGAGWLVDGAVSLAARMGVSETVIGLTIVAVGTSLPELVTSVMAALRGQAGIAFGNVVGSNIYNIFGILGATALVHPLEIPPAIAAFDGWVMLLVTAALILFALTGARVSRREGAVFLLGYVGYSGWLAVGAL